VLCGSAAETPELGVEVGARLAALRAAGHRVLWFEEMLSRPEVIQIVSHASVFVCPSVYEPLGIVNLEAMACETAVVATRTGGIPEVVVDGVTGLLVPIEPRDDGTGEPADPARFAHDLATAMNTLLGDPARAERYGQAGRDVAVERFGWAGIAERIVALYREVLATA
jgi:alpha-maltose-1-phosphate synthase